MDTTLTEKDKDLHRKIRKLLRKAENNPSEQEAELCIRKAQELIIRHNVDEEAMWANDPDRRARIEKHKFSIKESSIGSRQRREILNTIAVLHNCRCYYTPKTDKTTVVGFPNDIIFVEMLFAAVTTQMNFKMAIAQAMSTGNAKTFRINFLGSYAHRIRERLTELYGLARKQVSEDMSTSTDLVLISRGKAVEQWVHENVGRLRADSYRSQARYDHAAASSGAHAANETDISGGRKGLQR